MGIGDSISKAAENAMENLGGTAKKFDDGHTPDPDNPRDDVQVHSSISEGSNALDGETRDAGTSASPEAGPRPGSDSEPGGALLHQRLDVGWDGPGCDLTEPGF